MNPSNRSKLADRVTKAAEASVAARGSVSCLNMLTGVGWLDLGAVKRWQQGHVDCLEAEVRTKSSRIEEAMHLLRDWAGHKGLLASETQYVVRMPQRETLRFSRGGDPAIEARYRIHFVSPAVSEKKRERLTAQTSRPPDLVVIQPLNEDWKCHRCGGFGDLLIMETPGRACLRCTGLDDLAFLPAGDALLTRRAKAHSQRSAVVVRFSRSRYERQGLLVEPQALASAQRDVEARQSA